jgi:cytoskeletal protein CcmA (bactofilin family)
MPIIFGDGGAFTTLSSSGEGNLAIAGNLTSSAVVESAMHVSGAISTAAGVTASAGVSASYTSFGRMTVNNGGTNTIVLRPDRMATTGYFEISEMTAPGNPASNKGRLYVADDSGTTKLYFKDSAGTATNLLAGGSSTVSAVANGADNRVATFSSSDALNGEANLTFDGSKLAVTGEISGSGVLNVVGAATLEGALNVTGAITTAAGVTSSAGVTASYGHFNNIAINDGGTKGIRLQSNGQAFINGGGKLSLAGGIAGQTTLSSSGDANIVGKAYFENSIHVSGAISGAVGITGSSLQVNDSAVINPNGNATFGGGLRGKFLHMRYAAYAGSETNERFFDWLDITEATNTNNPADRWVAPYDGRLVKAVIRCDNAAGNAFMRIYAAIDGDESPSSPSGTPLATNEQIAVDYDTAHTGFTFASTGSQHFSAGQSVAISLTCPDASGVGAVNATFVFEYDMRGQAH